MVKDGTRKLVVEVVSSQVVLSGTLYCRAASVQACWGTISLEGGEGECRLEDTSLATLGLEETS